MAMQDLLRFTTTVLVSIHITVILKVTTIKVSCVCISLLGVNSFLEELAFGAVQSGYYPSPDIL